jgi:hypothetical protein
VLARGGLQVGRRACRHWPPIGAHDRPAGAAGHVSGFSLHAGVTARADERDKLEQPCCTISRPAVSEQGLSLSANGTCAGRCRRFCRDGTTHVLFEPLDLLARLAALVPRPRVNLARYDGVFAPTAPSGRG